MQQQLPDLMRPLREWMRGCPAIDSDSFLRVDFLGDEPEEYSLTHVPMQPRYKTNICGKRRLDRVQQEVFLFAAREAYGKDILRNMENIERMIALSNWIRERDAALDFPEIRGCQVQHITPSLTPFVSETGAGAAMYQMQITIIYRLTS